MIVHLFFFKWLLPRQITAITLWPFVVFKEKADMDNVVILNHEQIHLKQQLELLVILFYVIYISEYLYGLIRYRCHDTAYRKISFEREAYQNEYNLEYIRTRRKWGMWRSDYSKK